MRPSAVVKVGGSLLRHLDALRRLCHELGEVMGRWRVLVVPGGGVFADAVRSVDSKLKLSSLTSHLMALMAMDQYGLLLADLMPSARVVRRLEELEGGSAIILPYLEASRDPELPPSWSVTSDAVAARIAERLGVSKLVLVKDVDGIFIGGRLVEEVEASRLIEVGETCIDSYTPHILLRAGITCQVVNGLREGALKRLMEGLPVKGTLILPR